MQDKLTGFEKHGTVPTMIHKNSSWNKRQGVVLHLHITIHAIHESQ